MSVWRRIVAWFQPEVVYVPPKIGRVQIVPFSCCACSKPLLDGDLVVTVGRIPVTGHAECMILIKKPDGSIHGTPHSHSVLLYEGEWENWKCAEQSGATSGGELRLISFRDAALGNFR